MDLKNIRPKLMAFLICKNISNTDHKAPKTLVEVFDNIIADKVPCADKFGEGFWIYLRFVGGRGKQNLRLMFQSPTGKSILSAIEINFELQSLESFHDVCIKVLNGVVFEEFGVYKIRAELDGNLIAEHPLGVVKKS